MTASSLQSATVALYLASEAIRFLMKDKESELNTDEVSEVREEERDGEVMEEEAEMTRSCWVKAA